MVAVPGGIEELVTKSHNKDVLDHLLSKVVVDTEDFLFLPVGVQGFLEIARALEVLAKWFLDLYSQGKPISVFSRFAPIGVASETNNDTSNTVLGVAVAL